MHAEHTLTWLTEARRHIGVREVPGLTHTPLILGWWKAIRRGGIRDDETPWCAAFVGACLESVGLVSTRFESARSYLAWGKSITLPTLGCVAVLSRPRGAHVGFVVGLDSAGRLLLLGGNQGNAVSIAAFEQERVLACRWPKPVPTPSTILMPVHNWAASPGEA